MCRNIRVLYNFQPPTTKDEMRAASVQYVRKVSGLLKPSSVDAAAFEQATTEIAEATEKLLKSLSARTVTRTREGEREKARERWKQRAGRETAE